MFPLGVQEPQLQHAPVHPPHTEPKHLSSSYQVKNKFRKGVYGAMISSSFNQAGGAKAQDYQRRKSMEATVAAGQQQSSVPVKHIDLDRIPGLDDFDDVQTPMLTQPKTTLPGTTPVTTAAGGIKSTLGAKGQQAGHEGEGGLLGAVAGGLSSLTGGGGVTGMAGKLGDLAGSATSAGGGLLSSGKGLFKKFGF